MIDLFLLGMREILQPYPLIFLFLGTVAGIIVGCIPGFTITMGAALALPLTFGMTSIQGLSAMLGVLVGGLAGGQISGILLGIPGTPSSSLLKGIIAGLLGLISRLFGTDPMTGVLRFDFGLHGLSGGFSFLPILIGLFAFSQLMSNLERKGQAATALIEGANLGFSSWKTVKTIMRQPFNLFRSSMIGVFIGALPGAGGSISNILSYDQAGIIASEAGNNGTGGGELIPTMALGVPGSAVSAIMMGALILHGIQPGPMLIVEFPDLVYGVFVAFFLAHFFMLGIQLYGIRLFVRLTRVPLYVLVPAILVFCSVGSFSIHNRFFDIWVLFIFGILGYLMKKYEFPLAPVILGVILGPIAESNFRRALMTSSDYTLFFTRPISLLFLILCALSLLYPFYQRYREKKRDTKGPEG